MSKTLIAGAIVLALLLAGGLYYLFVPETVSGDIVIEGDYAPGNLALQDGATLTVNGNLTIDRILSCAGGDLSITVKGSTTINGAVRCEGESGDINFVAENGLVMSKTAEVLADGNVQFVSDADHLLTTQEEIEAKFREIGTNSGAGPRVGPLISNSEVALVAPKVSGSASLLDSLRVGGIAQALLPIAEAQAPLPPIVIAGKMTVATPPPGVKRLVILAFPGAREIQITDFELTGPDGRQGDDDIGTSCDAKGKPGEDAFRFSAVAPNLKVNNFTLTLGSGGAGGEAETTMDCDPGRAEGGSGGSSGNFKMIGAQSFSIEGEFLINPGNGGSGGSARAHGKDGKPREKGGDATAVGGRGSDNKKALAVQGTVSGTGNVQVGDLVAGHGGWASAEPGKGGDADACGIAGAAGGKGTATGGRGGDAKLTLGGSAVRAPLASDIGGKGGGVDAFGGKGGAGGNCGPDSAGGVGGGGGAASATEGKGGSGLNGNASDGANLDETGGDGGNGGDGCTPGDGGKGGAGDPPGSNGAKGKNLCVEVKKETGVIPGGGGTTPSDGEAGTTDGGSGGAEAGGKTPIQIIQYQGKYLPVAQLIVESEQGCDGGQPHWHAAQGIVVATDGSEVFDPGPQCGFGKTADVPTMMYTPR